VAVGLRTVLRAHTGCGIVPRMKPAGVAVFPGTRRTPRVCFRAADQAFVPGKRGGKNRVGGVGGFSLSRPGRAPLRRTARSADTRRSIHHDFDGIIRALSIHAHVILQTIDVQYTRPGNRGTMRARSASSGNVAGSNAGLTPRATTAAPRPLPQVQRGRWASWTSLPCPANEYASRSPAPHAEIQSFCSTKYDVTFPLFAKTVVNG